MTSTRRQALGTGTAEASPRSLEGSGATKPPKYGNRATVVAGRRFSSLREARRFQALRVLEGCKLIVDLECQVLYRFVVNGVKVGRYTADFRYFNNMTGETVVEDVKGYRVRDWSRTKKLMKALHGIDVVEV